jgi:hypothetical protein
MAIEGTNGQGCYAGDATIAEQLEWNRDTVAKYKKLAIDLGWFVVNGKRHGRAREIDIAIPSQPYAVEAAEPVADDTEAYRPIPEVKVVEVEPVEKVEDPWITYDRERGLKV